MTHLELTRDWEPSKLPALSDQRELAGRERRTARFTDEVRETLVLTVHLCQPAGGVGGDLTKSRYPGLSGDSVRITLALP